MRRKNSYKLPALYKGKKILVFGAGFIGSNLIKRLTKLGSRVSVFSRISRPLDNITFIKGEIENYAQVLAVIRQKYNIIFHCAGYSGTVLRDTEIPKMFQANVNGTLNILESVRLTSPDTRVILMGSKQEYGKAVYLPVDEKHPTAPLNHYGVSKLAATSLARFYFTAYKVATTVLRVSNVYGAYSGLLNSKYNVINYLVDRAKQNQSLTVYGTGSQLRDFLYIDDLLEALLLAGVNPWAPGEIFNVGLGKPMSFKTIVQLIADVAGVSLKYRRWPNQHKLAETGDYVSDINKINQYLGWKPQILPPEGISKCFP